MAVNLMQLSESTPPMCLAEVDQSRQSEATVAEQRLQVEPDTCPTARNPHIRTEKGHMMQCHTAN
jgi:hypothetical protein